MFEPILGFLAGVLVGWSLRTISARREMKEQGRIRSQTVIDAFGRQFEASFKSGDDEGD